MKLQNKVFLCFFVSLILIFSSGVAFADEAPAMDLVDNGTVSGDVELKYSNPMKDHGILEYTIPDDVDEIKSVYVIVNSYSGSGAPTYALFSNITLNTSDGLVVLGFEDLYCDFSMTNDPKVYIINNHTTKQYSDYQSVFDITDTVKDLSSGETIKISVNNTRKEGYNFDGRIKLIALVFAYDDGDNDKINYCLNIGQSWTQSTRSNLIKTKDFDAEYDEVIFENIGLSTYSPLFRINNKLIYDPIYEYQGSYFIYDMWDITNNFIVGNDTNFTYKASSSGYGSYKTNVQLLKTIKTNIALETTVTPPYANTIYAGVPNQFEVKIMSDHDVAVTVKVYAGENLVSTNPVTLTADVESAVICIDNTIRPITEDTVIGAQNKYENYTIVIEDSKGNILDSVNQSYCILYDGNLGKDYEYPGADPLLREYTITGDVIVAMGSQYAGASVNVNDVITVEYDGNVSEALLYVSYNWNNPAYGDFTSWNITFNDAVIAPIASYKDQGNLGKYGAYDYGLVVYNVTGLVVNGDNKLSINRTAKNVAVYPATLIVLTNDDDSLVEKTVYILEEVDLLSKTNNKNLTAGFNTTFDVVDGNATFIAFAASAEVDEGNLIINGENNTNVWNGTSNSVEIYATNVTAGVIDVYFESTGKIILALHQMVVVENLINKVNIDAPDVTKYFHGSERFVVTLTDVNGNPVAGESVVISLSGVNYTRTTDEDGIASIALNLSPGNYSASVSFNNTTVNSSVTILTTVFGDDLVKVYKNDSQYYATFVDTQGNPLANTDVTFNIIGQMYTRKTNENGIAKLSINLSPGEYIITATNPVNGEMHSNNITVLSRFVENNNIIKYYKNDTQYTAKVIGDDGKPVGAGVEVTFNIIGQIYKRTTDANGVVKLNINLSPGDYIITAEYKGCKVSNNITVLSILSAENLIKKYGNPKPFVVSLVDGQGKPYAGQTVTFNIIGQIYQRTTNSTGQARLNINLMPGEYIITSSFNGASVANTIKIEPNE